MFSSEASHRCGLAGRDPVLLRGAAPDPSRPLATFRVERVVEAFTGPAEADQMPNATATLTLLLVRHSPHRLALLSAPAHAARWHRPRRIDGAFMSPAVVV